MGRASVIVEAGEHSGSRIQARRAVEHGRPVILTDMVVASTRWGAELRNRPAVYIAGSTPELLSIVDRVLHDTDHRPVATLE
jgi:DNA processing protein